MEQLRLSEVAKFNPDKQAAVTLHASASLKVLLVGLSSGTKLPSHRHAGAEVTIQVIEGTVRLHAGGEREVTLGPGEFLSAEGEQDIAIANDGPDRALLLVHVAKK